MTKDRPYVPHLALLATTAVVLACVFHFTRIDLQLATPWYDPVNHTFPWRYAWITKYAVHRHLKLVQIVLGIATWGVALRASRAQAGFLATHRRRLWCIAWSFVAVPITIGVLHRLSPMHCPWDVQQFGGPVAYFDLFTSPPAGVHPGHCFPAAFVASGSWMLSFAWIFYPEHPRRSVAVGVLAFAWAFALGWVQQMRGAHFLSHTLWSIWVSWGVVLAVHAACGAWREGART